jgi:hypothetical protein
MSHKIQKTNNWLYSPVFDSLFILLPPFAVLLVVLLLPVQYKQSAEMPVVGWVVLILFIDVAHVYSTLFTTYLDKTRFSRHRQLFLLIPVVCYVAGVVLHLMGGMFFWRAIAYLAVFHFIRQQYGFMRLYGRQQQQNYWENVIDTIAIYAATLYPLLYWHLSPGRNFNWFVAGDFFLFSSATLKGIALVAYLIVIAAYCIKEARNSFQTKAFNLPKNILVGGTFISWYCGIVLFNGDIAFTALNVVAHGIPYMALIWAMTRKPIAQLNAGMPHKHSAHTYNILVFIGTLLLFSYLEEGLWDGMVWRDHPQVFSWFMSLPVVHNNIALSLLIPLLSLPQTTHYVLDGFIWRKKYA